MRNAALSRKEAADLSQMQDGLTTIKILVIRARERAFVPRCMMTWHRWNKVATSMEVRSYPTVKLIAKD
jgi:hypothetical protein